MSKLSDTFDTKMPVLHDQLETLGLSDNEARLYLAGLSVGPSTAQEISSSAGVKRTTAYSALEHLCRIGLAKSYIEGRKTLFHVEHPETLSKLLDNQRKSLIERETTLQHLIPELRAFLVDRGEPTDVQFLVKSQQIHELLFQSFLSEEKVYLLGSDARLSEYLEELSFLQKFLVLRSRRKLETFVLTDTIPSTFSFPDSMNVKRTNKALDFASVLVFSDRGFLQIHLNDKITGLHVENREFMELLSFFFQFLWDAS